MLTTTQVLHSERDMNRVDFFPSAYALKSKAPVYNSQKLVPPASPPALPEGPNPCTPEESSAFRNTVTKAELDVLLATATTESRVSDKYLNTVSSWKLDVELRPVRFSSRFSALWVRHLSSIVWFCVVDSEFFVFSLGDGPDLDIEKKESTIPHITVPRRGTRWTTFQQALIDRFENDDHVRAISAAVMLCTKPTGEYSNVARSLLPSALRYLDAKLCYDSPMDEDMMTVLGDTKTTDKGKTLYFDCGGGYCAMSSMNETMGRVSRISKPEKNAPFKESSSMLLPFVFQ